MRRLLNSLLAAISCLVGSYYFVHVPFSLWLWILHGLATLFRWCCCLPWLHTCRSQGAQPTQRWPCQRRASPVQSAQTPCGASATIEGAIGGIRAGTVVARDGTLLSYQVIEGGENSLTVLFCNGLGGFQFHAFRPIIHFFGRRFTYVTWDYRGLFGSGRPQSNRRLSVSEHAHDAAEVLKACGYSSVDILIGWSMGVQVGLEFALLYPEGARRLVLINGAHGQVFHSALQPIVRLPIVHDVARAAMAYAATHHRILRILRSIALPLMPTVVRLYVWLLGSRMLKERHIFGNRYVETTLIDLLNHLCQDEKTMETYLWLFQELNAHSVYHLLNFVQQDTLLISGLFDLLLPAYHMWEMERRMPQAVHVCDWWSSHFTLLEHPETVILHMNAALKRWGLLEMYPEDFVPAPRDEDAAGNRRNACYKRGQARQRY